MVVFLAQITYARKFKVALNPMYMIFLNYTKICVLSCLLKVANIKKIQRAVFELYAPIAVIKGVLRGHTVAIVTYCVKKNGDNVFTNGWAVFWYHDCSITW